MSPVPSVKPFIFLQARISSRRLPGKVLKKVYGKPLLGYLLDRLLTTEIPIVVLVPRTEIKEFIPLSRSYPKVDFFAGDKFDVLKRFYAASQTFPAQHYIRVTGDNPLTSITCLKKILKKHLQHQGDLSYFQGLPYGSGVEVISRKALEENYLHASEPYDREHVTPWLHRQLKRPAKLKITPYPAPLNYSYPEFRVTVDTLDDFARFRYWVKHLRDKGKPFTLRNVLEIKFLSKNFKGKI